MRHDRLFGTSVFCALLSTTSAFADVTGAQVWQNWKDMSASYGQKVTAAGETQQGDTLVVTGMVIESVTPEVSIRGTLDEVRFRDTGDGKVEVTMSPTYPITFEGQKDGKDTKASILITQTNLKMVAGGTPDSTSYDFSADDIAVTTTEVLEDGKPFPFNLSFNANGAGGSYLVTRKPADVMDLQSEFHSSNLAMMVKATDESQGSDVDMNATVGQLAVTSNGTFGKSMNMEKFGEALAAGFAVNMAMTYGPVAYNVAVTDPQGLTTVKGKVDGGSFGGALDKTQAAYKGGAKAVEVLVSGVQIPFPEVALRYAESVFDFKMPLSKSPDPQDFNMRVRLADVTVSDDIWAMIDPGAQLPRDPATLEIDAKGKALLTADLTDEAAMASGNPPGDLNAIDIPTLQLKVAGAELTGNGAFTFDNTDKVTFNGVGVPSGMLNLALSGGDGLLTKLVALGLVPSDQEMSVRMMMGIFAKPGPTPDTLVSTIEFKDKAMTVNGMPLPF